MAWFTERRAGAAMLLGWDSGRWREQLGVLLSLCALAGLAWAALWRLADRMGMPEMAGMPMPPHAWSATDFALMLLMWIVMMTGMMLPSAMPMLLLFRRVVSRHAHPSLRLTLFVLAYLAVWMGFSLAATLLQQQLEAALWLSPMTMRSVPWLSGALLMLAGLYQWLPLKQACLTQCQSPLAFLLRYPLARYRDAWMLGLRHGGYCLGCCGVLMGLLFVLGAMNLLWVAALGGFVLIEKLWPGPWLARVSGIALLAAGAALLLR